MNKFKIKQDLIKKSLNKEMNIKEIEERILIDNLNPEYIWHWMAYYISATRTKGYILEKYCYDSKTNKCLLGNAILRDRCFYFP